MEGATDNLFNYLHDVIYDSRNAVLDIEKLPDNFTNLGNGLQYFAECVIETKELAQSLSKGILNCKIPSRDNEIAAPLKSLHASLKHLTWQTQQIAQGDYNQRVEFMGDFSAAFNMMVEQLAERQQKLEDKIDEIQKKTVSLEQSNLLLTALMHYVPQQIIVIERDTHEILLMNNIALKEVNSDPNHVQNLIKIMSDINEMDNENEVEITYKQGDVERYFMVKTYFIEWNNSNAEILAVSDVSATKSKIKTLEVQAYRDSLTNLYNRTFGMLTLDSWLYEKRRFVLIFADLDNLKFINDEFGHNDGDAYIINAAKHLKSYSPDAVVCRLGGDEFMLLVSDTDYDESFAVMNKIYHNFKNDEFLINKTYSYSISFGIIAVDKDNKLPASDILSLADER
ncbi:MAG: diguanylate cyclase, partial [Treponema sp.]|nr:diguanylate cyclase [Treponema sp.]